MDQSLISPLVRKTFGCTAQYGKVRLELSIADEILEQAFPQSSFDHAP